MQEATIEIQQDLAKKSRAIFGPISVKNRGVNV